MPARLLFDINDIDLSATVASYEDIQKLNRHRGESQLIDRIVWHSPDWTSIVGFKHVRDDEWWCSGHIPGDPIFPGVLQVEAGAQLGSYAYQARLNRPALFMGFTRIDNTVFRRRIVPGDDLYLLCHDVNFKPKRFISDIQGVVNGEIAFETRITGMPIIEDGNGK